MSTTPLTALYKEIDGSQITTDIYLPPHVSNTPHHPVLINIHGGAFMLGHSRMVSMPQIDDCLARGWMVVVPNHRLCPQVNLLDGPITDCRDLLAWIYDGSLDAFLQSKGVTQRADLERVMAFGTSSGGLLALSLGYDTPTPPKAILNFYGAVHFTHPSWTTPLAHLQSTLPTFAPDLLNKIYSEHPIPTTSGISLEGQPSAKPDFTRPRDAFAFTTLARGAVLETCFPGRDTREIDPVERVGRGFPPTFIVHGDRDRMVSVEVSRVLFARLKGEGVECGMIEVEGEDHTFALGMEVGGRTWWRQREGFDFLEGVIRGV